MKESLEKKNAAKIGRLHELSTALSKERSHTKLQELILYALKDITGADGGTLYLPSEKEDFLNFEILINSTLKLSMGGTSKTKIMFKPLRLYDLLKRPNHHNIACSCFLSGKVINVDDAYKTHEYDFSGARVFDRQARYLTSSVLAIPLLDLENKVKGVIQLVNSKNEAGESVPFSIEDIAFAEFLGSHAAITLANFQLTNELSNLFESLARVIATAIDDKSAYTGKHCHRVPEVTIMIAKAAIKAKTGQFKNFNLNHEQLKEIKLAALLHDCGKVSTPVNVVDKSTKLETIVDRIEMVDTRFEVLKKDVEIEFLKKKIQLLEGDVSVNLGILKETLSNKMEKLDEDLEFIKQCNIGSEFMTRLDQEKVLEIAEYRWENKSNEIFNVLNDNEIENLIVPKGTLNEEEKEIINHHVITTQKMLDQLEFPKHLKNIPEIAGSHHEKINGTGYPKGLTGEQISIQAKMLCVADIFEALTARDRPYKPGKPLSETLFILGKMKEDGHLDEDIFNLFIDEKIYLQYAMKYLDAEQIDEVDHEKIPGYTLPSLRISNVEELSNVKDFKKAA